MKFKITEETLRAAAQELDEMEGWAIQNDLDAALSDPAVSREEMGLLNNLQKFTSAARWALVLVVLMSTANRFLDNVDIAGKGDDEIIGELRKYLYEDYVQKSKENGEKARLIVIALTKSLAKQISAMTNATKKDQ